MADAECEACALRTRILRVRCIEFVAVKARGCRRKRRNRTSPKKVQI